MLTKSLNDCSVAVPSSGKVARGNFVSSTLTVFTSIVGPKSNLFVVWFQSKSITLCPPGTVKLRPAYMLMRPGESSFASRLSFASKWMVRAPYT